MEEEKTNHTLAKTNTFFDDFIENIDLNSDIKDLYEKLGSESYQQKFEKQLELNKLRDENHKRYYAIDLLKFKELPNDLEDVINSIKELYDCLDSKKILNQNIDDSINTKIVLDNIYRRIDRLNNMTKSYLKIKTSINDEKQSKFSINYFNALDINLNLKKELIEKYNNLVMYSSFITNDIYEDLKRQLKREKYISEIYKLLSLEEENKIKIDKKDRLKIINEEIYEAILYYKEQLKYLEDLMLEDSKHINEFNDFIEFFNKLIAYDDTSYDNAKQTNEILRDELKFKNYINNFEELFIQEIQDKNKEEKFIFEKIGVKNLKTSLNYITANYMDKLDLESKNIIAHIYKEIEENDFDLALLNQALVIIVNDIWKKTITDVYEFNPSEDYYFICSNNQFIDEKYQTILITKKEIERVNDYEDYQIGFICGYNNNILYITENNDIMSVDFNNDLSNLKTPIQLEQEFINFKVCNRIALNGFKTKIEAVYFINDGNKDKYVKAIELANQYNLPLIQLKKDK